MKNAIRNLFNGAAAFVGATGTVYGGLFTYFAAQDYIQSMNEPSPITTLSHVSATAAFTAASALLFTIGYTRFFGSGRTIGALQKILAEKTPPQGPQP